MNRALQILLVLTILFGSTIAFANSHRRFFYGDEAAMTAGSGAAKVQDTGAIWYNPAGLGGNHHQKLQISGTAYALQMRRLNDILRTDMGSQSHTVNKSIHSMGVVPSALSFAFRWNDRVSFGIGIYQTENNTIKLRAAQQLALPSQVDIWNAGIEYHEQSIRYAVGLALGIQINDKLKWGIANFGMYNSMDASLRVYAGFDRDNSTNVTDSLAMDSQFAKSKQVGTFFTTGFQLQIGENWHTGVLWRSPVIGIWSNLDASILEVESFNVLAQEGTAQGSGDSGFRFDYLQQVDSKIDLKVIEPMEFQWSVAYSKGNSWWGATTAYQFPLKEENQHATFNASVGAHVNISKRLGLGAGFFTDNDSQMRFNGKLTNPGHRYGATGGIQVSSAELVKNLSSGLPRQKNRERRRILMTTLAFSYSIQEVEYQAMYFEVNVPQETAQFGINKEQAIFHRMELHLGGGFYF